jgi:molybdate transport system substrate-binding protein
MQTIHVLSAGAAKRLVNDTASSLDGSPAVEARFGPVGTTRERWASGEPCDVLILTQIMIDEMSAEGSVVPATVASLGSVEAGIAVRAGSPAPDIRNGESLRRALLQVDALYCPDREKSTAGAHFAQVLDQLGLRDEIAGRIREFPGGSSAMEALAESDGTALGFTQVTEIVDATGVQLAAVFPPGFALTTFYSAGVTSRSSSPEAAGTFVRLITSPETADARRAAGFDVGPNGV